VSWRRRRDAIEALSHLEVHANGGLQVSVKGAISEAQQQRALAHCSVSHQQQLQQVVIFTALALHL
jgi:hypothetical protein